MAEQVTGKRRLSVVLSLIAVVSTLVVLASFGVKFPTLPWAPVSLVDPVCADSDGEGTAIVDSDARRVLILNETYELQGVIDCERLNSPIEAVTDVCVHNGNVYVAGVQYEQDSTLIKRERVVCYNMHGMSEQVLYDLAVDEGVLPIIKTMDSTENGVYVVLYREDHLTAADVSLSILHIDHERNVQASIQPAPVSSIFDIGYSAGISDCVGINMQGALTDMFDKVTIGGALKDRVFTSLDVGDDGTVYLVENDTQTVCWVDPNNPKRLKQIIEGTGYGNVHVNGDMLSLCNVSNNLVALRNLSTSYLMKLNSVILSRNLSVMYAIVLFCRVYLALCAIVYLARKARRMIATGNTQGFGPMLASVLIVGVIALAIGYTTYGSYNALRETREKEINLFGDYLGMIAYDLSSQMDSCNDRNVYASNAEWSFAHEDDMVLITMRAAELGTIASKNGIGTYTTIYGKDDKGIYYLFQSSYGHILGSNLADTVDADQIARAFASTQDSGEITFGNGEHDHTMRRLIPIPSADGKSVAGVIEVGCRLRSFESSIANGHAERILTLLVIMLVVYLTYVELRECARCFMSYGTLRHHHDSIAILTRPFSFFVTLLSSIDAVMTTLIARSLLQGAGMETSTMLMALPSVMLGVGLALGQGIYSLLGSRVVIRKLMTRGAISLVVVALLTSIIVWKGSFWLYCGAKLFMAIPFGLLYTLSYSLPRRADTPEIQALAAGGIKRTDTSAAALGNVLGGYVAQALGNAAVYLLVALTGTIVIYMAWRVLPQTKHPLEDEVNEKSQHAAIAKLLVSKTTLPIIFFLMLPAILAAGYNSFLFPLFSANLGVSTSSINTLFVCGQLVVFLCIPTIERLEERYDKWRVAACSIVLLGLVFLVFSFNTSLLWAVVSIALVGVFCKASDGWKAMWPRSAEAEELTTGLATGVMFSVRSALLIVKPLVLGMLLSVDSNHLTMVVLGVASLVCSLAFYLTTRRSALHPADKPV